MAVIESIESIIVDKLGPEVMRPGLDRIKNVLAKELTLINSYQKQGKIKIVTIAGTNGKGETTYELQHLLSQSGVRTARWISPHIFSLNERINFNGEDINMDVLHKKINEAFKFLDQFDEKLSYYEFLFFIFCRLLAEKIAEIDVLLLEVGLGGRLDAVNIFDADFVGLTSISRDHENILGIGYKKILMEKLGVTRENSILVSNLELKYLQQISKVYKPRNNYDLFEWEIVQKSDDFSTRNQKLAQVLFCLLQGKMNFDASLARELKKHFSSMNFAPKGFKGRFEKMTYFDRCFIFVGAHNIDGIRKLKDHSILKNSRIDYLWCSFSKRSKEEIFQSIRILNSIAPTILTSFVHPKAMPSADLEKIYSDISGGFCQKSEFSLFFAHDMFVTLKGFEKNTTILVTGSYYFIGEVQKLLQSWNHLSDSHFAPEQPSCSN